MESEQAASSVSELYKIVYCIMYDERMRTWTRRVTNQPRIVHGRGDLTADDSQQEKRTMRTRTRPGTSPLLSHLVDMLPLNSSSISTGNVCPGQTGPADELSEIQLLQGTG